MDDLADSGLPSDDVRVEPLGERSVEGLELHLQALLFRAQRGNPVGRLLDALGILELDGVHGASLPRFKHSGIPFEGGLLFQEAIHLSPDERQLVFGRGNLFLLRVPGYQGRFLFPGLGECRKCGFTFGFQQVGPLFEENLLVGHLLRLVFPYTSFFGFPYGQLLRFLPDGIHPGPFSLGIDGRLHRLGLLRDVGVLFGHSLEAGLRRFQGGSDLVCRIQ